MQNLVKMGLCGDMVGAILWVEFINNHLLNIKS